jgi:hypothetical protein
MDHPQYQWPVDGVVVPAEPGRFDVYSLHYQIKDVGSGARVVVGGFYEGPVVAWRIFASRLEEEYFVCSPIRPGVSRSRDDFPGRVEIQDRIAFYWRDAISGHFFTNGPGAYSTSNWVQLCKAAIDQHCDSHHEQNERKGLSWLLPEPPDGNFAYQPPVLAANFD